MSDEHLIGKLRGAAPEGPPPSIANVRAAAVLGRRMRHRRRAAAALGSGLTVSGFVALLTLAGPSGQSVVQTPTPASGGPGTLPTSSGTRCTPADQIRAHNLERARAILGDADWQLDRTDGACPIPTGLSPTPNSAAIRALPSNDSVLATVAVRVEPTGSADCEPITSAPEVRSCETVRAAGGQLIQIERHSSAGHQTYPAAREHVAALYLRPDGATAVIDLDVREPGTYESPARQQQTQAWLQSYYGKLAAAVTDLGLEPDPSPSANADQPSPTPDPSATTPPDAPQCAASQIQISIGPVVSEATGQNTVELLLQNRSESACKLDGYPGVALLNAQGMPLPFGYGHDGDQMLTKAAPATVGIAPGGTAYLAINKYRCDVGVKDTAISVRLTLPGSTSAQTISLAASRRGIGWCGVGDPGSKVTVTPIEPTESSLWAHPGTAP